MMMLGEDGLKVRRLEELVGERVTRSSLCCKDEVGIVGELFA